MYHCSADRKASRKGADGVFLHLTALSPLVFIYIHICSCGVYKLISIVCFVVNCDYSSSEIIFYRSL